MPVRGWIVTARTQAGRRLLEHAAERVSDLADLVGSVERYALTQGLL